MKDKYLRMMKEVELGPYPQVGLLIQSGREVARKHSLLIFIVAFALAALAGLGAVVADPRVTVLAAPTVQGIYDLSFFADTQQGLVPLANNSLPVHTELALRAHVQDTSGHPAQRGLVIFQDCELKIPVPSAACDSGSGAWTHLITMSVDTSGNTPFFGYGAISTPTTIGFRFRYIGQGSGIANGASASSDVTWF